jgi:hypothetical protein
MLGHRKGTRLYVAKRCAGRCRYIKAGVVEGVEQLPTELKPMPVGKLPVLGNRSICESRAGLSYVRNIRVRLAARCRPTHAECHASEREQNVLVHLRGDPKDAAAVRSDVNRSEGAHVTSECPDSPPLVLIIVDLFPRSNRSIAT